MQVMLVAAAKHGLVQPCVTTLISLTKGSLDVPACHIVHSPQVRLADLEKGLLEALATAEGDLLEDTSLIERLSETKATAAEIQVGQYFCHI